MTVRVIEDVEEAIAREVRRITFHDSRTVDKTVLKEVFDVFTGEVRQIPIEPSFYDSSADTGNIDYPHFFIRLLKSREDRFTNRVIPQYGKQILCPIPTSPKAFEIVLYLSDGDISTAGNSIGTNTFRIRKAETGFLLRILTGPNKGTYLIDSVTPGASGNHTITLSSDIVLDLPEFHFNDTTRVITFFENKDLSTVKVGDIFEDSLGAAFNITAVDSSANTITIDGSTDPDTSNNSKITRSGDVLESDPEAVTFTVMDPNKPVVALTNSDSSTQYEQINPAVPIDLFYLVRIDSKEKDDHTAVATRIWEEFLNPPRTALTVVTRTKLSAEQKIVSDVPSGGSNTLEVSDTSNFNVGDPVFIFDDFLPTKSNEGAFDPPLEAKVVDILANNQLVFDKTVPDTFTVDSNTKVVSNAIYNTYAFHFVDHRTKDNEGAQYWVHEFQVIVQVWVDRQGEPSINEGTIQKIETPTEDDDGNLILC